jgi:hypothetical protein
MQKLILDYSKWRSGGKGPNRVGKGDTLLLNDEGFMCCLGQFCKQLNPLITDDTILNRGTPGGLREDIPLLNVNIGISSFHTETVLSQEAIKINDDYNSSSEEKIEELKSLFLQHKIEIEVINKPESN